MPERRAERRLLDAQARGPAAASASGGGPSGHGLAEQVPKVKTIEHAQSVVSPPADGRWPIPNADVSFCLTWYNANQQVVLDEILENLESQQLGTHVSITEDNDKVGVLAQLQDNGRSDTALRMHVQSELQFEVHQGMEVPDFTLCESLFAQHLEEESRMPCFLTTPGVCKAALSEEENRAAALPRSYQLCKDFALSVHRITR